jgi:hypothetical protein
MDQLTFCNNYLYSYGQVIFIFVDKLSLLWCLFCLKRYVCCLCLYVKMEPMRDGPDLSMRTNSKETIINKPLSHLFTADTLPLHDRKECSLTLITDRVLISNRFYELAIDMFNLCNGLYLTSVIKNSCNGCLRRPLLEVHIGNRRCGGQPWCRPAALICHGRQVTTITDLGACNGCVTYLRVRYKCCVTYLRFSRSVWFSWISWSILSDKHHL